ncbi:hypothetical protein Q1695_003244 [Nippostrongylus brasiliensis]|nr:hypothetical protein Q1695_003244 [Nippostrongylus brasiliensis]
MPKFYGGRFCRSEELCTVAAAGDARGGAHVIVQLWEKPERHITAEGGGGKIVVVHDKGGVAVRPTDMHPSLVKHAWRSKSADTRRVGGDGAHPAVTSTSSPAANRANDTRIEANERRKVLFFHYRTRSVEYHVT